MEVNFLLWGSISPLFRRPLENENITSLATENILTVFGDKFCDEGGNRSPKNVAMHNEPLHRKINVMCVGLIDRVLDISLKIRLFLR